MIASTSPRELAPETAVLGLGAHRLLQLRSGDLALLSEGSTGWCVLSHEDYGRLLAMLRDGPLRLRDVASDDIEGMDALWRAGLLLADGRAHPAADHRQERFPSALLLKLTGACNLACTYCYDYDARRTTARLTIEKSKEAIDFLLAHRETLSIAFHGGEPLLRFALIKDLVQHALHRAGSPTRVRFSVQTNGMLLTPDVMEFFVRHEVSVGISLDGVGEQANRLRPGRGKRGSLWRSIERLFREHPEFVRERCGFLAVVSRTSAPALPEFVSWLQAQGVGGLTISFLDLAGRGHDLAEEKLSPDEAVGLYQTLTDMVRTGAIARLALRNLLSRIQNLFTFQPRDFCHRGPCGAGGDFVVLDAEGTYRACDCVYHPFFELGPGVEALDAAAGHRARSDVVERHAWLREHAAGCRDCALYGLCGGTCVAKAIAAGGRIHDVDPIECAIAQWLYPELLNEFALGGPTPLLSYHQAHAGGAGH